MKIIDLSLPIFDKVPIPPGVPRQVRHTTAFKGPGHWQATWLELSAHTGTHVDSPLHVKAGAPMIGDIPLEKVIGEAVVLDVTHRGEANAQVTAEDFKKYEGQVKEGDIVIVRTDWGRKVFPRPEYYSESPYLTVEGARWLVDQKPRCICFDFFQEYNARLKEFTPDQFEVHNIMLGADIILVEGLTNLDKLSGQRVQFYAVPVKIGDSEAAPGRAFAIEP
ncbi:MAG: cyclase family protein [Nitrospinota bacterium]